MNSLHSIEFIKYKGKPDGEEKLIKHFTTGPKVKNLANWILSL